MLPKDILQYARKFSPVEIENAIKTAIDAIGRTIIGRLPTAQDYQAIQDMARAQALVPPAWQNPYGWTTTTTNTWVVPTAYTANDQTVGYASSTLV